MLNLIKRVFDKKKPPKEENKYCSNGFLYNPMFNLKIKSSNEEIKVWKFA